MILEQMAQYCEQIVQRWFNDDQGRHSGSSPTNEDRGKSLHNKTAPNFGQSIAAPTKKQRHTTSLPSQLPYLKTGDSDSILYHTCLNFCSRSVNDDLSATRTLSITDSGHWELALATASKCLNSRMRNGKCIQLVIALTFAPTQNVRSQEGDLSDLRSYTHNCGTLSQ